MDRKFFLNLISILIFTTFLIISAQAQQNDDSKPKTEIPPMSLLPDSKINNPLAKKAIDSLVTDLELKSYEAILGNASLCRGDTICHQAVVLAKVFLCVANTCDGTDNSKEPTVCFKTMPDNTLDQYSISQKSRIVELICSWVKSPEVKTRRAILPYFPDTNEDSWVKLAAFILAEKKSALVCENYIKNYVGDYGPKWNSKWYRELSGCRILSHERTRQEEEHDFYIWFKIVQDGVGNCSDIKNDQMRDACNAPGAASPIPAVQYGG